MRKDARRSLIPYRNLQDYLKRSGVSQAKLADELKLKQSQISRYASGETLPRPPLQQRIAEYCGLPLESFTIANALYRASRRTA